MGWSIGFDSNWNRDIGYGVPCKCDHPDCNADIHRGLAHVCGGEPYGGDEGCGLYFCGHHLCVGVEGKSRQVCNRCSHEQEPFDAKPDTEEWIRHKLTHPSWQQWRDENPSEVADIKQRLNTSGVHPMTTALSVSQVAGRWGCSRDAVYDLIKGKRLPAFPIGHRTTRVLLSVVEAYEGGQRWENGVAIRLDNTGSDSSTIGPLSSGETRQESTASGYPAPMERTPQQKKKGARRSIDTLAAGRF